MSLAARLTSTALAAGVLGAVALSAPASAAESSTAHVAGGATSGHHSTTHLRPGKHKLRMRGCHTRKVQTFTVSVTTS